MAARHRWFSGNSTKPKVRLDAPWHKMLDRYPSLARLDHAFLQHFRLFRNVVKRMHDEFGDRWALEFEGMLTRLFPSDEAMALAVQGYASFALDSLRRQAIFDNEGTYPNKSFAEAAAEVYLNETYMNLQYLPGLLLSHYLWGHHYRQLRFFQDAYVQPISVDALEFAEIGIGTGVYSRTILQTAQSARGTGFDISPHAKAFAEMHMRRFGVFDRYTIELRNILNDPPACRFRHLVCVEVLEHLEDPASFLNALRGLLAADGKAFITAALNAANADHIYLYRNPEEVIAQLRHAGFAIEQYFVADAYKSSAPDRPPPSVAAFVVTQSQHR